MTGLSFDEVKASQRGLNEDAFHDYIINRAASMFGGKENDWNALYFGVTDENEMPIIEEALYYVLRDEIARELWMARWAVKFNDRVYIPNTFIFPFHV